MPDGPIARLARRAQAVQDAGLRRELNALEMTGPVTARDGDRSLLVLSSNDYLGLAHHPETRAAWQGSGSGSSRLIAGSRPAHHALEDALESHFGRPALVFSSGYQANLAVLTTLFEAGDSVASDALNHASIIDGLRLSRASRQVIDHGMLPPSGTSGGVVEGLYSMDGDTIDLGGWRRHVQALVVDEAHAVGTLGPGGRGIAAASGVHADVLVGTFGKAYGAAGAFVICPQPFKELLISLGRSFVYTTALAEPAARAARVGLGLATDARRRALKAVVIRFRAGLAEMGLVALGHAHIVPVVLGPRTMAVSRALRQAGIFVPGIRWPTVPKGHERLRFSLSAAHQPPQLDRALDALDLALRDHPPTG
jgi:7-keto-8-aminopelargonate synthetase-like enzyme